MIDPFALDERPPSEVEWEELLVKLDIAPRALRVSVEDAPPGHALDRLVLLAATREAWFGEGLELLREGRWFSLNVGFSEPPGGAPPARDSLAAFTQTRERNFAKLQRRGLGVWDWRGVSPEGRVLTTWRLVQLMAWTDGQTLAEVRGVTPEIG